MRTNLLLKYTLAVAIFLCSCTFKAAAQTTDTPPAASESYIEQLKSGRLPGFKFAPVTTQLQPGPVQKTAPVYSIRDLITGKPGGPAPLATSAAPGLAPRQQAKPATKLASDATAGKTEKAPPPPPVPHQ